MTSAREAPHVNGPRLATPARVLLLLVLAPISLMTMAASPEGPNAMDVLQASEAAMAQVETVRFKGTTSFDGQSGGRALAFGLESAGHRAGDVVYYRTDPDPPTGRPRESIFSTVSVVGDMTNGLTCSREDNEPWIGGASKVTSASVVYLNAPRIPASRLFEDPVLSEEEASYIVFGYLSPAAEASGDGSATMFASLMIHRSTLQVARLWLEIQLESSYTTGAINQTFDLWDFDDPSIVIEVPEPCQDAWDHFAGFD